VIFWSLAVALFLAAVMLLRSVYHEDRFRFLLLALLLIIFFDPLHSDLGAGNLACWQLFGLALSLWLAHRLLNRSNFFHLTASAFLCLQVFLTLLKPNLLPVSLLLGVSLWKRHGFRLFAPATLAGLLGAILLTLPCLSFRSWTIWYDWFKCIGSIDNQSLLSWTYLGNFAPATILAQNFGIGISAAVAVLAAGIGFLMTMALALAIPAEERGLRGWGRAVGGALGNPDLSASVGVIVMLVFSPLTWIHYYLLTLLPALWLISRLRRKLVNLLGWLNIFIASAVPLKLLPTSSWGFWIADIYALNLVFLLAGMLVIMATGKLSPGEKQESEWRQSEGA